MPESWRRDRESLGRTLIRNLAIALVIGAVVARSWGDSARWPLASAMALWFSLGGHWVEVWFLDWLRPRLAAGLVVQVGARLATWFVAGIGLGLGAVLTGAVLGNWHPPHWLRWWHGGVILIGVELVAHLLLRLRGRASFYSGRG